MVIVVHAGVLCILWRMPQGIMGFEYHFPFIGQSFYLTSTEQCLVEVNYDDFDKTLGFHQ